MEINQNEIKRKSTMVCALNFDISPMFSHTHATHNTHTHIRTACAHIMLFENRTAYTFPDSEMHQATLSMFTQQSSLYCV